MALVTYKCHVDVFASRNARARVERCTVLCDVVSGCGGEQEECFGENAFVKGLRTERQTIRCFGQLSSRALRACLFIPFGQLMAFSFDSFCARSPRRGPSREGFSPILHCLERTKKGDLNRLNRPARTEINYLVLGFVDRLEIRRARSPTCHVTLILY